MSQHKWSNNASKENGKLGGEVMRQRRISEYETNPKYCKGCCNVLVFGKHHNIFCSLSCSAKYTNRNSAPDRKRGPTSKPKEPKPVFSTLYKCVCKHCGYEWRDRTAKQICEDHKDLYSHAGRAQYWFTFSLSKYPDLFDGDLISAHGMRSKDNPGGVTRDHKVSVNEAIINGYDPYYIRHPLNCELMLFSDNAKKHTRSSMTYEQLVISVNEYDRMVGPAGFVPAIYRL
jgi:hypothetical protein